MKNKISRHRLPEAPTGLSPETRLLLACCRKEMDSFSRNQLAQVVGPGLDWENVVHLADRHCVAPLVWRHLKNECRDTIPEEIRRRLTARSNKNVAASLLLANELGRMVRIFQDAGILLLPLKGIALSMQIYGELGLRHVGDLDLVVAYGELASAEGLLQGDGYRRIFPEFPLTSLQKQFFTKIWSHHFVYRRDSTFGNRDRNLSPSLRVEIELHWKWSGNARLYPVELRDVLNRCDISTVGGVSVPVMSADDLLLFLCAHGAKHAWSRLKWLCDVHELIGHYDSEGLDRVMDRANELGSVRTLSQGMFLSCQLLGTQVPRAIRERLWHRLSSYHLAVSCRALLTTGPPVDEKVPNHLVDMVKAVLYKLSLRADVKYKLLEVFRYLISPKDWYTLPLPDPCFPMYLLLRPFLWSWSRIVWGFHGRGSSKPR